MAAIALTQESVAGVKHALARRLPHVGSAHLSEALARALGHRTHAALLTTMESEHSDPPIELLNEARLNNRLEELGYQVERDFGFEQLNNVRMIATAGWSRQYPKTMRYKGMRAQAWRNLMVCAVNAGLEQKLFSLREDDNRWPDADDKGFVFDFMLPNGLPARGYVDSQVRGAELGVRAAVNPKGDLVRFGGAGFNGGDAVAEGWVERRAGVWLQSSTTLFKCRRDLVRELAALQVEPKGYGDRGRVTT